MSKTIFAGAALALSILMSGAIAGSASAAPAVGHVHRAAPAAQRVNERGHNQRGHIERRENHEHFEHRRFRRGPVLLFNYGNRGHDGCYWLKRRALNSGSHYWWHRYQDCRQG